ncbi:MAG: hypothetical protein HQM10_25980 [Candidatus Riflebacteria bacterium]|nr:hypothetical protein [Candidatus Riflebacteria bacterium]
MFFFEMAETFSRETFKTMQKAKEIVEGQVANSLDEMAKSQAFCLAMKKTLESSLDVRSLYNENIKKMTSLLQISTRDDSDKISQQVFDCNLKLERMSNEISELKRLIEFQNEKMNKGMSS